VVEGLEPDSNVLICRHLVSPAARSGPLL
jgi:hypothetical protein